MIDIIKKEGHYEDIYGNFIPKKIIEGKHYNDEVM